MYKVKGIPCSLMQILWLVLFSANLLAEEQQKIEYQFALTGTQDVNTSIQTIIANPDQYPFRSLQAAYAQGRGYQATWLKFDLLKAYPANSLGLQFYYPGRYTLFYQDSSDSWHNREFGRNIPYTEWDQSDLRSAVVLKPEMDLSRPFYVKIHHHGIQPIGHTLTNLALLKHQNRLEGYFWGAVIGLKFLAMFGGMLLFAFSRARVYIFFAGICASSLVWSLMNLQLAQYIDIDLYEQNTLNWILNTTIALLGYCIVQFMRFFVDFRRFSPNFDRTLGYMSKGYIVSYITVVVFAVGAPAIVWPMHLFSLFIFVSGILAVIGLLIGVIRRDRSSIILALAWIPGSSVATVSVPTYYGLLPGNWWTENVVMLGLATAVMMFSVAIADQVLQLRQQRNRLLKARNQELLKKVDQQTSHLLKKSQEIEQQREKLATTLSYKEDLLANIAHELKTPLTLILGVLSGKYAESERKRKLQRLVFRISHLLDNMLELSKAKKQFADDRQSYFYKAHEFVEFYITTYKGFVAHERIQVTDNQPAYVFCLPDTLDKVITNLINNAIKYSPQDSAINIHAWVESNEWHLLIENQGSGIAPEKLRSVFERYVQIGETRQSYGLGLGLPLVRQLLEAAGGKIEVFSIPNEKTSMTVTLPLARDHQLAAQEARGVSHDDLSDEYRNWLYAELQQNNHMGDAELPKFQDKGHRPVVYCIDDNTELLSQIQEQLENQFALICFTDPQQALQQAKKDLPDMIISDVMMPQLSGFDVLKSIREEELTSHIPVILLTARSDQQSKAQGLLAMADDYITKPYEPRLLALKIDNLIAIRGLLKTRFEVNVTPSTSLQNEKPEDKLEIMFSECQPEQKRFMQKVINCLKAHLNEPDFSIKDLSAELFLSDSQIRRKVKAISGYSPQEVMRIIRLEAAASMIREGESLKAVAHDCGFSSQSHMGSAFKAYFGQTPNQFRNQVD